ncbi:hypothetical protein ACVWW4_004196 [Bradyrhizobium sp. LB7.1]
MFIVIIETVDFAAATAARGQRGGRGRLHGGNEN